MTLDRYLDAQQRNLEQIRELAHFRALVPLLNDLYERSAALVPRNFPPHYGRFLLVCHKAFLSAATLIGRGQPDDAAAVTRRAIETALLARAVKHDLENLNQWAAFEERIARWQARDVGRRPRPLKPEISYPANHEAVEWLRATLGILSDAFVHLTPEFILGQDWRIEPEEHTVTINLRYFAQDQRAIERELVVMADVHSKALELFNECYDGAFQADQHWAQMRVDLESRGSRLSQQFIPPERPPEENRQPQQ